MALKSWPIHVKQETVVIYGVLIHCAVWVYAWLLDDQIWVVTQLGIWQCMTVMAWQRSSFQQSFKFPQCGSSIWPLVWSIKYPLNIQNLVTCLPCEYYLTFYQLNLIKGTKITQTLNCGHLFFNWNGPLFIDSLSLVW